MAESLVWKILLIDDDEDDYLLTREMLAMAQGKEIRLTWASSMESAHQALSAETFDAVLVDYDLGEHNGLEFIHEIVAQNFQAPLILITGRGGYQVDFEARQAGASLYLTKTELNPPLLDRSIRYAIEKKQADIALKKAHEELENRVEERTKELAQANRDLQKTKLDLAARVVERTAELQHANKLLADQLKEHQHILAELQREKKKSEQERDKLRAQEEQVARISRLYVLLSQVNEAIVRTHSVPDLYAQVCAIIAEAGFPAVWIGEVQGQQVLPVAICGPSSGYLHEIRVEISGELGNGPTGRCIRENRPVINDDFDTNPTTHPWRAAANRYGIRASAAFPLSRRGKAIGALTLYASEPHAFDTDQVTLLQQLSADVSYFLDALDQEELRIAAEQALRTGEQRYRSVFEGMTEGFALHELVFDEQGQPCDYRFLELNPAFETLTGLKREHVIGKLHNEILPGDDPYWLEAFGKVAITGEPYHFENYSPVLKQHYEVYAYRPAPNQFAVLFMNITERKQFEQKIRESELRYRTLFESMQEGFYLGQVLFDENGSPADFTFLDVNEAYTRMVGISRQQMIGKNARQVFPEIKKEWLEVFGAVQRSGKPAQHSSYSDIYHHYFEAYVFRPAEGQFAALVTDVSERMQAEKNLRETQERANWLARFPEENPNPVVRVTLEGVVLYCNPPAASTAEWNCSVGQPLPPEFQAPIQQAITQGKLLDEEIQLGEQYYAISVIPILDGGYTNIYGRNIGLRIKAENALRLSEERYRTLFNSVNEGFTLNRAIYDEHNELSDLLVVEANPSAEKANGLTRETFIGRTWRQLWPEEAGDLLQSIHQVVDSGEEIHQESFFAPHDRWYDVRFFNAGPDLVGVVFLDITERKRADDKIAAEHLWFRTTLDSIGDAVITTDPQGNVTFLNPIAEKLSGWGNQQAAGQAIEKVFPLVNEQSGALVESPVGKVLHSGTIVGLANHTVLISRDGQAIPIEDSAAPIKDGSGQTLGVVMVFHDVVEKRTKEKNLQRSEALYRAIARNFPDGAVFVVDRELRFLAIEGSLLELLGGSKEMEGRTVREALGTHALELVEDHFRRALAGEFLNLEALVKGRVVFFQFLPLVDDAGSVLAAMVLLTDITRRKQNEESLRDAERVMKDYAQKLERSNRDLQDFASIASHDLQEPLRKIKAFSELLSKHSQDLLDEESGDYLRRIQSAVLRMQEQIDSLLSYARVTTKTLPFRPVSLNEVTDEAVSSLEILIEREGGRVECGNLPTVDGDPLQLRQVLQNLVGNALKFHRPGVPPLVQVCGRVEPALPGREDPIAILEVKDNGIGFEMQYLERIFQPFERLHGVNEYPGTGMGLAICKKIVERHQGTITAQSVVGAGTTFIVTLPVNGRA